MDVCVCVSLTCVCFVQVALEAAQVGGFKGTELTAKGLLMSVVWLDVTVQTGEKKHSSQTHLIKTKSHYIHDERRSVLYQVVTAPVLF